MFETSVVDDAVRRDAGTAHDQRHPDRRLVHDFLAVRDPVLAVHEPVVGGKHDQRPVELVDVSQDGDDPGDRAVDREQRLELPLVCERDLGFSPGVDRRQGPDRGRLVADVGLVV
jgi:hypothetical protein